MTERRSHPTFLEQGEEGDTPPRGLISDFKFQISEVFMLHVKNIRTRGKQYF
jgi:hypothetical protein